MRLVLTLYGSKVKPTIELARLYRNKAVSQNISSFIFLIRETNLQLGCSQIKGRGKNMIFRVRVRWQALS
ncbi:unnamed protein product [Brassica oleracea var. botrytis]